MDKALSKIKAEKKEAALSLNTWVKNHPFLQATTLDKGEASAALLLL